MRYANTRYCENQNFMRFDGVGKYDTPKIRRENTLINCEWINYAQVKTCKEPGDKGVHFFIDDYRFERLWHNFRRYSEELRKFRCCMTPDFSMYTDWPMALQIWNHYRRHYIGAALQTMGVCVYPTIGWSDERSFDWCFDGDPVGGVVCVSSVGTQKSAETKRRFLMGYNAMLERLMPEAVIFYGGVPKECRGNIVRINPFYDKFREAIIGA